MELVVTYSPDVRDRSEGRHVFVGLSCCTHLKEAGVRVALLGKGAFGSAAKRLLCCYILSSEYFAFRGVSAD